MPASLMLGPVVFTSFEVPDRISFGGHQRLIVHAMPGGGRVVDAMGPDEAPIRWSGVFSGQAAAERVRMMERLRRSGVPLLLVWDAWRYLVIVQDFEAEVTNIAWIPYRITLCVLPQLGSAVRDWLDAAVAPALALTGLGVAALQQGIDSASGRLAGGSLSATVSAAGELAQYVTARAFAGAV